MCAISDGTARPVPANMVTAHAHGAARVQDLQRVGRGCFTSQRQVEEVGQAAGHACCGAATSRSSTWADLLRPPHPT